jgi:energy-coupling factor transport system permease protein
VASRANALHAGAWWLWALGLATAASRTTNPLLLGLLAGVAGYVVAARRTDAPWARSYGAFLKLGLLVIGVRLVFSIVLGSPIPGDRVMFTLPEVPLPDWAQGVRIGGRVTAEGVVFALYDGLKLAVLLACLGAANALANPARLLKSLPGALYEVGVAAVVAMTFAPNLVADVLRLRSARRLRGRPDKGVRAVLGVGLPVLEGALERSVALAAAMDARGYGRTAPVPPAVRRTTAALTLGGLLGVCAGTYGLLAAEGAGFGLPVLLVGLAAALGGLRLGGRRTVRTRYRPDAWGVRAWVVSGSGAAVAALMIWAAAVAPSALHPSVVPLTAPTLPLWPAAAALAGLLPAWVAPAPADARAGTGAGTDARTGADSGAHTDVHSRTGTSARTGTDARTGSGAGTGAGSGTGTGTRARTRPRARSAPGSRTGSDSGPGTGPGTGTPAGEEPPSAGPARAGGTVPTAGDPGPPHDARGLPGVHGSRDVRGLRGLRARPAPRIPRPTSPEETP